MKSIACLTLLTLTIGTALAQDTRPAELANANERLNTTYQRILSLMASDEQVKLRKAQRAWIEYRDLDCAWAFSAQPLDCQIQRTQERVAALEDSFFRDKAGTYRMGDDGKK
ncbi:lysozyme inhibitor LprI family protein [Massilia sp. 9I]|uniref:lysozyme inhibitor LprI family protein n=1 Tax=Massilia sp. 9I TaxID=2653152 RepID=UPI0012F3DC33|nr:exported hypothetical protein [Massilia sp. 9I]